MYRDDVAVYIPVFDQPEVTAPSRAIPSDHHGMIDVVARAP